MAQSPAHGWRDRQRETERGREQCSALECLAIAPKSSSNIDIPLIFPQSSATRNLISTHSNFHPVEFFFSNLVPPFGALVGYPQGDLMTSPCSSHQLPASFREGGYKKKSQNNGLHYQMLHKRLRTMSAAKDAVLKGMITDPVARC